MARLEIGGKYGKQILFKGNKRFLPAHIRRIIDNYFNAWNALKDMAQYPAVIQDLGAARADKHFLGTDWESLSKLYEEHMQRHVLVLRGLSPVGQPPRFAVAALHAGTARPLKLVLADYADAHGILNDNFDIWRVEKLLRRAKAQLKFEPTFVQVLRRFGTRAISIEESLSFFRQIQAYHATEFLAPELRAILSEYIDAVHTLKEPLKLPELVERLRASGAELRVHTSVEPVLRHYAELAQAAAPLGGTDMLSVSSGSAGILPVIQALEIYHRKLPHWRMPGSAYFVTWRLHPQVQELSEAAKEQVAAALHHFDGQRYELLAYVVMNDHVHVLLSPMPSDELTKIVHSWTSYTALKINELLHQEGSLWQAEYFDRIMRDENEVLEKAQYILNNPQKRWPEVADYKYVWCKWLSGSTDILSVSSKKDGGQNVRPTGDVRPTKTEATDPRVEAQLGDALRTKLYAFQRDGVAFLTVTRRALLADDMGLGKTLQAIAAALVLKRRSELKRALIVCPASLKYQWQSEIQRFSGERCEIIGGDAKERQAIYAAAQSNWLHADPSDRPLFYAVNYELVYRDIEQLKLLAPELLILDEAQRVKNFRTKTAQAVFEIESPYTFVLTGTPLENQLMELYTILRFIDERCLGRNPIAFRDRYVILDQFGGILGYRLVEEVTRKIAAVTLRRTKLQTLSQLPPLIEQQRWLDLTDVQRQIYQELQGQARQVLSQELWDGVAANNALTALQRLREVCDTPELIDPQHTESQKLTELLALLEDEVTALDRQVIIFTQWTRMGQILVRELTAKGYSPSFLHGGIPTDKRQPLIERFMRGEDRVFISTDAGGLGLNLQAASLVVNYDLPFNPAKLNQRIARAHRLGQEQTVFVVNLVCRNTVETKLLAILKEKQRLFDDVFGEISDPAQARAPAASQRSLRELLWTLIE